VRTAVFGAAAYIMPLLIFTVIALVTPAVASEGMLDGVTSALIAVTPPQLVMAWVAMNGTPTVLLVLCLNRWARAVGPCVLAFVTTVVSGLIVAWFALLSTRGSALVIRVADATGFSLWRLLIAAAMLTALLCGVVGWYLLRWIRRGYVTKHMNDRSLMLDAIWLVFASFYSVAFALEGPQWSAAGVLAFAAYKLSSSARVVPGNESRGLTFLRVFSLGRRSDRLFERVGRQWRYVGCLQVITGPDVAHTTVQPHQLLDFLAGRLRTHFISTADTVAARVQRRDQAPDFDGRFRVNNFFCHANSWEAVVARLVSEGDVVLMDLRSFSAKSAGCIRELRHLIDFVPLTRCVLVVDATTDASFLQRTLEQAWQEMHPSSPNRHMPRDSVPLHRLGSRQQGVQKLLRQLCEAA
jgi:hypothetical protein